MAKKNQSLNESVDELLSVLETELSKTSRLSSLLENNLEQAELILAIQDMSDGFQTIAEKIARSQSDLLPILDKMRQVFGPDKTDEFNDTMSETFTEGMKAVADIRKNIGNATLRLEGKEVIDNDMASYSDDSEDEEDFNPDLDVDLDVADLDVDGFDGHDAAANDEPLGRAKKESIESNKVGTLTESGRYIFRTSDINILNESGNNVAHTCVFSTPETVSELVAWVLNEASEQLPKQRYVDFSKKIATKVSENPAKVAGWIAKRKYGSAVDAQLLNPLTSTTSAEPIEESAKKIAALIQENVKNTGFGRAAKVLESYKNVKIIQEFVNIFGKTPQEYSLGLMEATLSPFEQKQATDVISKIAGDMATDKSLSTKPAQMAQNKMNAQEKQVFNKMINNMKSSGKDPKTVGDFLKNMDDEKTSNNNNKNTNTQQNTSSSTIKPVGSQ